MQDRQAGRELYEVNSEEQRDGEGEGRNGKQGNFEKGRKRPLSRKAGDTQTTPDLNGIESSIQEYLEMYLHNLS